MAAAVGIIALFFFVHYLFASTSAHTAAVLRPASLAAVVAFGSARVTPAVVLMLLYTVGIMGVLTPYHGTGPAPVWFHAGLHRPRATSGSWGYCSESCTSAACC